MNDIDKKAEEADSAEDKYVPNMDNEESQMLEEERIEGLESGGGKWVNGEFIPTPGTVAAEGASVDGNVWAGVAGIPAEGHPVMPAAVPVVNPCRFCGKSAGYAFYRCSREDNDGDLDLLVGGTQICHDCWPNTDCGKGLHNTGEGENFVCCGRGVAVVRS